MTFDDVDKDIFASIGTHFQSVLDLPVFFEGRHVDGEPALDYFEVRIDDLNIDEIAHEQYHIEVGVDLKIVRRKTNDLFAIRRDAGKCAEAFRAGIPYTHLGPPDVLMGCLETQGLGGRRHKIETQHYGQLSNKSILVSTVATTLSILL